MKCFFLSVGSEDNGFRNGELMEAIGSRMKAKSGVLVTHPRKQLVRHRLVCDVEGTTNTCN